MSVPGKRYACGTGGHPAVSATIVSATGVKIDRWTAKSSCPNDHFAAAPHRRVRISRRRRIANARGDPAIRAWAVSAAGVAVVKRRVGAAPDNHFAARPYRGVTSTTEYIIRNAGRCPTVSAGVVSATGVQIDRLISSAPDDHFTPRPLYGVVPSSLGRVDCAGSCPAVRVWIVSAAAIKTAIAVIDGSAPDDHLAAGPYCRVQLSGSRGAGSAGSCPTVGDWIISAPGIQLAKWVVGPAPDNHLGASPYCCVTGSPNGWVGGTGRCPRIFGWVVPAASV